MKPQMIVVDDFYPDPDEVVQYASKQTFVREANVNYPGLMAPTSRDVRPAMQQFARLLGGIDIKYNGLQGGFRITTCEDMQRRRGIVHIDSSDWSAVIHLSRTPTQGTYFYRHRRLGVDYASSADERYPDLLKAIMEDTNNPDAWEVTQTVPAKYNRLVIFDGKHFHSGPRELTGTSLADGRLTQNFFFFTA
jgi:hypothetical protein